MAGGTTKKWEGTVKKIFPALRAGICAPHFQNASGAYGDSDTLEEVTPEWKQ